MAAAVDRRKCESPCTSPCTITSPSGSEINDTFSTIIILLLSVAVVFLRFILSRPLPPEQHSEQRRYDHQEVTHHDGSRNLRKG